MSVMAVGPARTVDGPLPVAPRHNLFAVAEEVNPERWEMGLTLWPFPFDLPTGIDPCLEGTFRTKDSGAEFDPVVGNPEFVAFTAYQPIICSAFVNDFAALRMRAEAVLDATDHLVGEQQLVSGAFVTGPFLGDGNVAVLASGVVPEVGLSHLEQAIGATGKAGMIHADPATAAAWTIGRQLQERNGRLETVARGTLVVAGDGYIGAAANAVAPAAGSSWAFASGPAQYARGALVRLSDAISESLDRATNTVVYIAERDLVVAWDLELQAAVQIDWTP